MREPWIGYVKRVLGLYSFTFLSSPELKYRAERDGVLGFSKASPEAHTAHLDGVLPDVHRAIELLKLIDDVEGSTSNGTSYAPAGQSQEPNAIRPDALGHEARELHLVGPRKLCCRQPAVLSF